MGYEQRLFLSLNFIAIMATGLFRLSSDPVYYN